ncbi:MAG: transposase, partial [Longimicrobiales bacterium]|nr:transposase [Longimicrobiales bacterium]
MASRTKLLTDLTLPDLWKEVKDPATLWGDLTLEAQRTLKLLLQNRMHEELTAYLHAPRYRRVRGRQGVRNGRYVRALTTTWGTIPDLEIPRARDGGFRPSVLPRYQRRRPEVDRLIQAVFLASISTRRVGRTLAEILGDTVSASTVSTITRTLDHAVAAWHRRPLQDEYRYLILDGLSLRVKTPDGTKRRLILVAYGITQHGRRRMIDYRLAKTESQGAWEGFLKGFLINLAARGLVGERLALITTDGHRGLHAALELVYPTVPRQACWVHVLRNVAQRLR